MSNDEAACLAHAVVVRELATAPDDRTALQRLQETRACAAELEDALEERAERGGGAGAEAALALLEDKRLSESDARKWWTHRDDAWRAVAARAFTRQGDRSARRSAMVDASPRVRRGAIRAAAEAGELSDLDLLFESARLDPEPLLRNEALRAMSAVVRVSEAAARPRAAELALRLRDLWTTGDDAIREDVAVAWALAPVFENGGREALRVTIAAGQGPGALTAAGVVLRTAKKDTELAASATALLARTIDEGSRRDRLHAIAIAEPRGMELEALRRAARDDDLGIRVPAFARLLDSKADRDAATKALEAVAAYGASVPADGSKAEHGARARLALAYAGDLRVQAWIERDLASTANERRLGAATALAALGRSARAAPLLADGDASVRTRAACTLLVAARH